MSSAGASKRNDAMITDNDVMPKQPIGGISSSDIPNITTLVNSLRSDIKHIKTQLQNLPPFPTGKCSPHHHAFRVTASFAPRPLPKQR